MQRQLIAVNMDLRIIVNWNTAASRDCLKSVFGMLEGIAFEVIVVDNASADGSVAMLEAEFPQVRSHRKLRKPGLCRRQQPGPAGHGGPLRAAAELRCGPHRGGRPRAVSPSWKSIPRPPWPAGSSSMPTAASRTPSPLFPRCFTLLDQHVRCWNISFRRRYPSKRYPHSGIRSKSTPGSAPACSSERAAIDAVGMLDERYFFFFEETDWAYQMQRAGWKIYHVPAARIYHLQGRSIGRNVRSRIAFYRSRYQFFRKWRSDAYYVAVRIVIFLRLAVDWLLTSVRRPPDARTETGAAGQMGGLRPASAVAPEGLPLTGRRPFPHLYS